MMLQKNKEIATIRKNVANSEFTSNEQKHWRSILKSKELLSSVSIIF